MPKKNRKPVSEYKKVIDRRPGHLILSNEERKKYIFKSPFPQEFSLPSNIIYYIARNPAFLYGHRKLISTCKYLLLMSRILLVRRLIHNHGDDCDIWKAPDLVTIDLKNQFFKFWIHNHLIIQTAPSPNLASILIKYCYKFSLREIEIYSQVLTFEELQILVSGGNLEQVSFIKNIVKNEDGSITDFEKVFELLCCKNLGISLPQEQHGFGKNTTYKIIEILSSDQIPVEQYIRLNHIQDNFDIDSFSQFLKANITGRQHTIDLHFADEISEEYKNQLQEFVNEIIQIRGIYAHTVPLIVFPGRNEETFNELCKMRHETVEGILKKLGT